MANQNYNARFGLDSSNAQRSLEALAQRINRAVSMFDRFAQKAQQDASSTERATASHEKFARELDEGSVAIGRHITRLTALQRAVNNYGNALRRAQGSIPGGVPNPNGLGSRVQGALPGFGMMNQIVGPGPSPRQGRQPFGVQMGLPGMTGLPAVASSGFSAPAVAAGSQRATVANNRLARSFHFAARGAAQANAQYPRVVRNLGGLSTAAHRTSAALSPMARNSQNAMEKLDAVSSAAAGMMLGLSVLQGNVTSLAFGLIFLRFSFAKLALQMAAVTVLIGGAAGIIAGFVRMTAAAGRAGIALEKTGQQLANYFRSGAVAQAILSQADMLSRMWGIPRQGAIDFLQTLEQVGMRTDTYIKGILNASAATGRSQEEIAQQFANIWKAPMESRGDMVKSFARDMNLPMKEYAGSLELATALNERFKGSVEANANTTAGMIGRIVAAWQSLLAVMGTVVNEYIKPMLAPIMGFINGMIEGFTRARDTAKASGELARSIRELSFAARRLVPLMTSLGTAIGKALFWAIINTARIIKALIDGFLALWNRLKPVRDAIIAMLKWLKQLLDPLMSWIDENKNLILGLAAAYLGMMLFNSALQNGPGLLRGMADGVANLTKKILSVPNTTLKYLTLGKVDAMRSIDDFIKKLKEVPSKIEVSLGAKIDPRDGNMPTTLSEWGKRLAPYFAQGLATGIGVGLVAVGAKAIAAGLMGAVNAAGQVISWAVMNPIAAGMLAALGGFLLFPTQTGKLAGFITSWIANGILKTIIAVPGFIASMWNGIFLPTFTNIFENAKRSFSGFGNIIGGLIKGDWGRVWRGSVDFVGGLLGIGFDLTFGLIMRAFTSFVDLFNVDWSALWDGVLNFFTDRMDKFVEAFKSAFNIEDKNVEPFKQFWRDVKQLATDAWGQLEAAVGWVQKVWDKTKVPVSGGAFVAFLNNVRLGLGHLVGEGGLINRVAGYLGVLWSWFAKAWKLTVSVSWPSPPGWVTKLLDMGSKGLGILGDVVSGVTNTINIGNGGGGGNVGQDLADSILGTFPFARAHAGKIPGRLGTKRLVLADAGEVFHGSPTFDKATGRSSRALSGGGDTYNIYVPITDSVVTNSSALEDLASSVAGKIMRATGTNKRISLHRI